MNGKANRTAGYKKSVSAEDGRVRRDETVLQIRKEKKALHLAKRRGIVSSSQPAVPSNDALATAPASSVTTKEYTSADIGTLLNVLKNESSTQEDVVEAVRGFRRMLSKGDSSAVTMQVIAAGALPFFVKYLHADFHIIQFEAAWALTNVASTQYTSHVVECGAVPLLVQLLRSPNADVREQCAWCLGNIAGDSTHHRDLILKDGAMHPLMLNILNPASDSLLGNCVWTMSNFCRGKPQPDLNLVRFAIPDIAKLVIESNPADVVTDALWALSYLSDGATERIQAVVETGVTGRLVEILAGADPMSPVVTPILRTLGNFTSGNDIQTQAVLDAGMLREAGNILKNGRKGVRKDTYWLISNIAAGNESQRDTLLSKQNFDVMRMVVNAAINGEYEIRKEATWVIANIATLGTAHHVEMMVQLRSINALSSVLPMNDSKLVMVALDAIEAILKVGANLGLSYPNMLEEVGGVENIEALQTHQNDAVYEKAVSIIEDFFGVEEEDENLAPTATSTNFEFGLLQKTPDKSMPQPFQQFNFGSPSPINPKNMFM